MTACMFHHHVVFARWLTKLYSLNNISMNYISLYIKCKIRFWYFIIIKLKLNNVLKSIKMTSCMHYSYLRTNYKNVRHDYIIHKQICPSTFYSPHGPGYQLVYGGSNRGPPPVSLGNHITHKALQITNTTFRIIIEYVPITWYITQ